MPHAIVVLTAVIVLAMAAPTPATAQGNSGKPDRPAVEKQAAQGQGQSRGAEARGQGQGQGQGQSQAQRPARAGQGQEAGARGRDNLPPQARAARARRGGPAPDRAAFNRDLVERAVKVRRDRGGSARGVEMRREGGELRVVREDGRLLFALDEERAGEIGYWRVGRVPGVAQQQAGARARADRRDGSDGTLFPSDREVESRSGAPAFCHTGEGHPVWGSGWCIDKGFGVGDGGQVWGWDRDVEDVVLRRPSSDDDLDRAGLEEVLGDIVFGRIALQSLVLGADEPLTGRWLGETEGPRVLRIHAGDLPVAELVDRDRDDAVDVLVFNLGG